MPCRNKGRTDKADALIKATFAPFSFDYLEQMAELYDDRPEYIFDEINQMICYLISKISGIISMNSDNFDELEHGILSIIESLKILLDGDLGRFWLVCNSQMYFHLLF